MLISTPITRATEELIDRYEYNAEQAENQAMNAERMSKLYNTDEEAFQVRARELYADAADFRQEAARLRSTMGEVWS